MIDILSIIIFDQIGYNSFFKYSKKYFHVVDKNNSEDALMKAIVLTVKILLKIYDPNYDYQNIFCMTINFRPIFLKEK